MEEQLKLVWNLLSEVSDKCAILTWKSTDGSTTAPADWQQEAARLEYRIFGVFLLSHALLHRSHSEIAWNIAMLRCVSQVEEEFIHVDVEGNDFDSFVAARVRAFGRWSQDVRDRGLQDQEPQGWIRILKNNLLACSSDHPLPLDPPTVVGDFLQGVLLEGHLTVCLTAFYIPLFYSPLAHLCERHRNILELSPERVAQLLEDGLLQSEKDARPPKRSGILGRLFGRKSG